MEGEVQMIELGEGNLDWDRAKDWLAKSTGPRNPREMLIQALRTREMQAPYHRRMFDIFRPTGVSRHHGYSKEPGHAAGKSRLQPIIG